MGRVPWQVLLEEPWPTPPGHTRLGSASPCGSSARARPAEGAFLLSPPAPAPPPPPPLHYPHKETEARWTSGEAGRSGPARTRALCSGALPLSCSRTPRAWQCPPINSHSQALRGGHLPLRPICRETCSAIRVSDTDPGHPKSRKGWVSDSLEEKEGKRPTPKTASLLGLGTASLPGLSGFPQPRSRRVSRPPCRQCLHVGLEVLGPFQVCAGQTTCCRDFGQGAGSRLGEASTWFPAEDSVAGWEKMKRLCPSPPFLCGGPHVLVRNGRSQ